MTNLCPSVNPFVQAEKVIVNDPISGQIDSLQAVKFSSKDTNSYNYVCAISNPFAALSVKDQQVLQRLPKETYQKLFALFLKSLKNEPSRVELPPNFVSHITEHDLSNLARLPVLMLLVFEPPPGRENFWEVR